MATHILFLKGVNLGKHNKLNMQKLCVALGNSGFEEVRSFIQSGNIFLKSRKKAATLEVEVKDVIKKIFNMDIPVIGFDKKTYTAMINNFPFKENHKEWLENSYCCFFSAVPHEKAIESFPTIDPGNDLFSLDKQVVYTLLEKKYHETQLNNNFFEKKLVVPCTTRNYKTASRILELLEK